MHKKKISRPGHYLRMTTYFWLFVRECTQGISCCPCAMHTTFKPLFGGFDFKFDCHCHQLSPMEYCQNCVTIRYCLNFVAGQICVGQQQLPDEMTEKLVKIETFLEKIPHEPFFIFQKMNKTFI